MADAHKRSDAPQGRLSSAKAARDSSAAHQRQTSRALTAPLARQSGRYLDQQAVDTLEAARQLVAAAAALALVVLQIIGLERQGALAGLQHQGRAQGQHG